MCLNHFAGIVHRDLAARNVLVTASWVGIVSDFGLAREVHALIIRILTFSQKLNHYKRFNSESGNSGNYYRKTGEVVAALRLTVPVLHFCFLFEGGCLPKSLLKDYSRSFRTASIFISHSPPI